MQKKVIVSGSQSVGWTNKTFDQVTLGLKMLWWTSPTVFQCFLNKIEMISRLFVEVIYRTKMSKTHQFKFLRCEDSYCFRYTFNLTVFESGKNKQFGNFIILFILFSLILKRNLGTITAPILDKVTDRLDIQYRDKIKHKS